MKRLLYSISIVIFMLLQARAFGNINYLVPLTTAAPVIDGDISTDWQDALSVNIVYPAIVTAPNEGSVTGDIPDDAADISGTVYLKWDFEYLYVAVRVHDQVLNFWQTAPGPFNSQDVFQMCFNPLNAATTYSATTTPIYDFAVRDSSNNGPFLYKHTGDVYALPNAELGGQVLTNGYIIEAKLPWGDFSHTPLPGDVHGVGFILVDSDGGTVVETYMYDYGNNGTTGINTVSGWNTITLIGENNCGLWGIPVGDINMDCLVDLEDFAIIALQWMGCTLPSEPTCVDMRY